MLLAGTNDKNILTFDIKHLLEVEPFQFDASSMGNFSEHLEEEEKELGVIHEENDDTSQYKYRKRYDEDEEEEKVPDDDHDNKLDDTDFLNKQEADDDEQLKTIL